MVKSGVAYALIIIVLVVVLVLLFSGLTGNVTLEDTTSGDKITESVKLGATVDNTLGDRDSVWAIIWDNTGGIIWQGILVLVGGGSSNQEAFLIDVEITSPPFPELDEETSFDYTIYANTTAGDVVNKSGSFIVGPSSGDNKIMLKAGWNMISFSGTGLGAEDREVNLGKGWNLIGFSGSKKGVKLRDVLIDGLAYEDAVSKGKIQNKLAHYDSVEGSYGLVLEGDEFKANKAYWVYSNSAKKMKFVGAGGGAVGETIPLSRVILTYEETGVGVDFESAAHNGFVIQYYDSVDGRFKELLVGDEVDLWKGYFFYSPYDDFSITIE